MPCHIRKAAVIAGLLLLPVLSSCMYVTGDFGEETEAVSQGVPVEVKLSVGGPFLPGEEIMYGIGITNHSSSNLTLAPLSAPMTIKRIETGEIVCSSGGGRGSYVLDPRFPFLPSKGLWDQQDDNGLQVAPGHYEMTHVYTVVNENDSRSYSVTATDDFVIAEPDAAMTLDLTPNLSLSRNGMSVTLTRLTLNAVNGEVTFFGTPPGYDLPPPEAYATDYEWYNDSITSYSREGQVVTERSHRGIWNQSGIEATWDIGPVQHGTRELTFIVNRFARQEGPWIFTVSLE